MNAYLTPYYNPYLAMINGYTPAFSGYSSVYPYVYGPTPYLSPSLVSYNPYLARVGGYLGPYLGPYMGSYAGYLGYP